VLEDVVVNRVILAAWRLQLTSLEELEDAQDQFALAPISRETVRAEAGLETALVLLDTARHARQTTWGRTDRSASKLLGTQPDTDPDDFDATDLSNEWPTVPPVHRESASEDDEDDGEKEPELASRWHKRLTVDESVSADSPVVKGTWVTVNEVVSLIVDGWTWSDVLRSHPELCEDDIRACLSYTVDQDNQGGY
jgi:uncharacterized protein (DUF433 family)